MNKKTRLYENLKVICQPVYFGSYLYLRGSEDKNSPLYKSIKKYENHIYRSAGRFGKVEILEGYELDDANKKRKEKEKYSSAFAFNFTYNGIGIDSKIQDRISLLKTDKIIGAFNESTLVPITLFVPKVKDIKKIKPRYIQAYDSTKGRIAPFKNIDTGDYCVFCKTYHRHDECHSINSSVLKEINTLFNLYIRTPYEHVRMCRCCAERFSTILSAGRYWCFECGRLEKIGRDYGCDTSVSAYKNSKIIDDEIKLNEEIAVRDNKKREWGI